MDAATALAAGLHRCSAGHFLFMGGCYDISVAGGGVCREARDGTCGRHAEMVRAEAKAQLGTDQCVEVTGGAANTCKTCGAIIGGTKYCSACNDSGSTAAPTDGVCTADNAVCSAKSNGVCTTCTGSSFMFQGGCYATANAPGNTMCTQAANGICSAAAAGYFVPPTADRDNSHQSVIPYGDVEEIAVKDNKKYKGVAHCTQCSTPATAVDTTNAKAATCTACEDGYFVENAACTQCHSSCLTCSAAGDSKCKSCKNGYFLGATSDTAGKCIQCSSKAETNWPGVDNCAKCTSSGQSGTAATCTECANNYYLKTDGSTTSCVAAEQCNNGFFPTTDSKNKKVCVKCSDNNNGGIANCAKCSLAASPTRAGAAVTCTECTSNKLSPLGDACLAVCPAGTYDSSNVCTPCHTSCASCESNANQDSCTACYPGHVLSKSDGSTAGTCIPECTGRYAENCEANQCTAVLGGSKYCSKCKSGFVPVNGLCVSATTRAPTGCTPGEGVCTACTDTYFLQSGGCYLSTAYPGNTLCSQATTGKCTNCANGQQVDSNTGSCPACDSTCKTCTATNDPTKCSACFPGYYLDAGKACKKCSETSGTITGVDNCISCDPPSGNQGSVTCYVKTSGGGSSDNSTGGDSGPNLSSGAIAGISVAVIVVVGGLVGFLCWWFVCRGKA
ncbi:Variant-specific surface protein [Giardia duodenalis]|uniref:Variant-specific surface protein n=1 Tax=Giardia intestinalis TaxID=5741 RepID=V6TPK9_GIAIN|nr:Variant-specific surface protein [Giardia intestinalis]